MIRANFILACVLFFLWTSIHVAHADHAVNINTADKEALTTLTGIGEVKAQAIIDYRNEHGSFVSKEDIMNVSGIGTVTYENIKDHITIGNTSSSQSSQQQSSTQTSSSETDTETTKNKTQESSTYSTASTFRVNAGGNRVVLVGTDVSFTALAHDAGGRTVEAHYKWNFGDGSSSDGRDVTHRFEYPGRYAVVLEVVSRQGAREVVQITVSVEPLEIALETLPDGGVGIENLASRDIELSGWRIIQNQRVFVLPHNTFVLKGSSIRLSPATLGFKSTVMTTLSYPDGRIALHVSLPEEPEIETEPQATPTSPIKPGISSRTEEVIEDAQEESKEILSSVSKQDEQENVDESSSAHVAASAAVFPTMRPLIWLGAVLLLGLTALAVFAIRQSKRKGYKGWTIIEDTSE